MNPFLATPKDRFRQSDTRISNHRKMVEADVFERSSDAALLQYLSMISSGVRDGNTAMAAGFRLQGAFELMHTLKNISEEPPRMQMEPAPQNLNHQA